MVAFILPANSATGGYEISNSLRLNDDDSPSLAIDLSSPNTDKFTISFWIKLTGARSYVASLGKRLTGETGDDASINIDQGGTGRLGVSAYDGVADSNVAAYNSNTGQGAMLRDYSAWYNLIYAFDTGQGTAGNRFKWYINGVLQSGYNTTTTPAEDADLFPSSGSMFRIGKALSVETRFADCYFADYYYVDGQQYDHTYFGETNDNGVWVPVKNGTGAGGTISFGTNGFHLEFKQTGTSANASGIGADTSGNDNHLTPSNLAATDITTDTPMNNFMLWNPLDGTDLSDLTFSEGNTKVVNATGVCRGTLAAASGKWYWEIKQITAVDASNPIQYGIADTEDSPPTHSSLNNALIAYSDNALNHAIKKFANGTASDVAMDGFTSISQNDIIQFAFDADTAKLWVGINGTYLNSGDPAAGSNEVASTNAGNFFTPCLEHAGVTYTIESNFGNAPYSISSGNSDANGYGNFEYAVPSGFYSWNTKNLAEYG